MDMIRTERGQPSPVIHAEVVACDDWLVAQCREVAVVTQGRTLDETAANLREALAIHLDGEELDRFAPSSGLRLVVRYETAAFRA